MSVKEFSESAQGFTKSPLGIIALFIVLVYGFASLVVGFGNNIRDQITPLIYFMVFFPVAVYLGFLWLVARHHNKLYGPSDFRDEENFLKTQISSAVSLAAAVSRHPEGAGELRREELDEIVEMVSKTRSRPLSGKWRNKILWVDEHPDNNIYERQAFEKQGLQIKLVRSTEEALQAVQRERFAVIISDMGRKEGPLEGYVLLDKLRNSGNSTPFVIYAGSSAPEHTSAARERGALGCTNKAQELYQLVMNAIESV